MHLWLTNELCLWWHLDFADLIYDIVADCSDNVPTRYLVNDACVLSGKPLVSASALRMEGQVRSCISVARVRQRLQMLTLFYLAVCVGGVYSWQYTTTVEAPATDVCTQCPHPQRQWPTVLTEGCLEWVSLAPWLTQESLTLYRAQSVWIIVVGKNVPLFLKFQG